MNKMGSNEIDPKALVITVNYRSSLTALKFLDSLCHTKAFPEIAVVIADNSSGEEDLASIRKASARLSNVKLLASVENRGYFGAARFAFEKYRGQGQGLPDWLIVCNHDVLIEDPDFFSKLFSQDAMAAGVIAPRIQVLPSRADQNPFMRSRPRWLRWTSLQFMYSNYGTASLWDWLSRQKKALKILMAARAPKRSSSGVPRRQTIYAPHGAFIIFSRRYFEAGGYLDGNLFLYGEEVCVGEICRSLGLPVVYDPSLCVLHDEHRSTGQGISRFTYECQKNALRYVAFRYLSGSGNPVESGTEPQALALRK